MRPLDGKKDFQAGAPEDQFGTRPRRARSSWMRPVASCLFGTLLGAGFAGLIVSDLPESRQVRMFFIYLLVLAPLISFGWYWLIFLFPGRLAKKMKDRQANPVAPIHPK